MRDASGPTTYACDARSNLSEAVLIFQGRAYTTQYRYELADKLILIRYPSGLNVDNTSTMQLDGSLA